MNILSQYLQNVIDFIEDYSSNRAYQLQHNFNIQPLFNNWISDTKVIWGLDYFLTLPDTRGTILSD